MYVVRRKKICICGEEEEDVICGEEEEDLYMW